MKNIKTKVLEARISSELDRELKKVAQEQGRTESAIVRELVEEYIRKFESKKEQTHEPN